MIVTVRISPANIVSANHRAHWAPKAQKTRAVRMIAWTAARMVGGVQAPVMDAARITVTVHPPDRRRRRDLAQNLAPTIKALIDGIVDAGILPDDSDEHVRYVGTQPGEVVERGMWVFDIELEQVTT